MPAPAFLALNNGVAILCLAGERQPPRHPPAPGHHRGRAETAGTNAASPVRGQTLPPSLWAPTHTGSPGSVQLWASVHTSVHTGSPGAVQAVLGGGLGGRRRNRDAESRNDACLGAGVWPDGGRWAGVCVCVCCTADKYNRAPGGPGINIKKNGVSVLHYKVGGK